MWILVRIDEVEYAECDGIDAGRERKTEGTQQIYTVDRLAMKTTRGMGHGTREK